MSENIEIRVKLDESFRNKIEKIKSFIGTKNNTEMIRVLINEKFRQISNL